MYLGLVCNRSALRNEQVFSGKENVNLRYSNIEHNSQPTKAKHDIYTIQMAFKISSKSAWGQGPICLKKAGGSLM